VCFQCKLNEVYFAHCQAAIIVKRYTEYDSIRFTKTTVLAITTILAFQLAGEPNRVLFKINKGLPDNGEE